MLKSKLSESLKVFVLGRGGIYLWIDTDRALKMEKSTEEDQPCPDCPLRAQKETVEDQRAVN